MANTVNVPVQFKRTSVPGKVPTIGNIPLPGEPAVNMVDGTMYISTGSNVFAVGSNNVNVNVTDTLRASNADILVLATNTAVANTISIYALLANGTPGLADQILSSNGTSISWQPKPDGFTGSVGYTGSIGTQGTTGFTGSAGSQGTTGFTGSQGIFSSKITANTTLVRNTSYTVDTTSSPVTLTLPASPTLGDFEIITDGNDWSINNVTVLRNGNPIAGDNTNDLLITTRGITVWFVYNGGTIGWAVTSNLGPTGYTGSAGIEGGVTSVSNSDGSLTISPNTGNVVASLNANNPNIWTAQQTFNANTVFSPAANLTLNAPGWTINQTWSNSANKFIGAQINITDLASLNGFRGSRFFQCTVDGSIVYEIDLYGWFYPFNTYELFGPSYDGQSLNFYQPVDPPHQINGNGFFTRQGKIFGWGHSDSASKSPEAGLTSVDPNIVEVNSGRPVYQGGTYGAIALASVNLQPSTVATLPASPATGMVAYVSDGAASLAWGDTITAGANTKYLVWYNGTNWTVAGK